MKIIMCFDQDKGLMMIIILCESNQTLGHNLSFFCCFSKGAKEVRTF